MIDMDVRAINVVLKQQPPTNNCSKSWADESSGNIVSTHVYMRIHSI